MAKTVQGVINSVSTFLFQNKQALSSTFQGTPKKVFNRTFSSTDVTKLFFNTYTITPAGTTIDLTAVTDVFGAAVTFATVSHIQVVNNDVAINLTAGGGANPIFAAMPVLVGLANPNGDSTGSCLSLTTNLTISGSTKNLLLLAASGSIQVDVYVVGN